MTTNSHFGRTKRQLAAVACALAVAADGSLAHAETGTAVAGATVLATPGVVTKTADLSFGKFASGAAGSITISTSGARSVSGGVLASADGPAMTAAAFVVSGAPGTAYSITHGGTSALSRTGGAETMSMTKSSVAGATPGGSLNDGARTIYVGATLDVGANQAAGAYTGTVVVTVEYN